jgi:hypothetical protein
LTILTLGISRRRGGRCPISFIIDASLTGNSFRRNKNDCFASPSRAMNKFEKNIFYFNLKKINLPNSTILFIVNPVGGYCA